jgi:hypothetical protein
VEEGVKFKKNVEERSKYGSLGTSKLRQSVERVPTAGTV